jgi:protein O-mannosyl-transferase
MAINKTNKINYGYDSLIKSPIIFSVTISLIVLAIFSGVLSADFVMWDDNVIIYENPNLGKLSLARIYWAFTDVDSMMRYNPLTLLSWSATYHFFGMNPFGYHLINWLLHGLSSGVLFLIIRKILLLSPLTIKNNTKEAHWYINIAASLATLCWAIHPLRVEPVAWATDRTYCQALFFLLLSTLFYLEAVAAESDRKRYIVLIISAFIFYTVSLFSYAIGTTFFAIFFILDIFLFKRIGGAVGWWKSKAAKKVLLEKLIFALPAVSIGIISVVVRVKSAGIWLPPVSLSEFGLIERIMQAMYILSYYIWRPFYPLDFAPVYTTLVSFRPLSMPFILSAFSVVAVSIVLFIFRKRWPMIIALWLAYIILLIPVMGFFEHPHYPSDRYSLVSSICLSILIALGLIHFKKIKYFSIILFSVLLIVINVLGWLTFNQIKIWHNTESLFSHMIKTLENNSYQEDIYSRLGKYLYINGKKEQAIINFEKALSINPYNARAHKYWGQLEFENGNLPEAAYHFKKYIIINPNNFEIHHKLSYIFVKLNKKEEALFHYGRAIDLQKAKTAQQNQALHGEDKSTH